MLGGGWEEPERPGAWIAVDRVFRDGHQHTWWALEGIAGPYGPDRPRRLVIATPDPATLPETATWYLETSLPQATADLAEVARLVGPAPASSPPRPPRLARTRQPAHAL